jgi:hypothetical protein
MRVAQWTITVMFPNDFGSNEDWADEFEDGIDYLLEGIGSMESRAYPDIDVTFQRED